MSGCRKIMTLLLFFPLLLSAELSWAWDVGVAPATRKILPETPMPEERAVSLKAARNEWEAFQIVIRDSRGVEAVDVGLSDLSGPEGAVLPASGARLFREHYLDIYNESSGSLTLHERAVGLYPDPLIPFVDPYRAGDVPVGAPFDLMPGETGCVFVDWYVPEGTPPGAYTGVATVTATGRSAVEIPLSLTVWEFDLPREKTIGTAYGFSSRSVRNYHGGPDGEAEEGYENIVDNYYLALHEHRIDPTTVSGPVDFDFDEEGKLLPIDWTAYDEAVRPWLDGSRFPDGVGVTRFNVARFIPGRGTESMTDEQYARAGAAFARHLEKNGWWNRAYVYSVDEPWLNGGRETYERIKFDANLLFEYTDLWRGHILVTSPYKEIIADEIGIWCPVTTMYEEWFFFGDTHAGREVYAERLALGQELWFYVCNADLPPYAGYDIDTAIGYEPRIVKWGAWFEYATGFLYWSSSYWIENDPWNVYLNLDYFGETFARNGDGFLLYPGDHNGTAGGKGSPGEVAIDGPIVSYRLKQIRDGFEDWELFRLATELGGGDYAREQVSRAYIRFGDFCWENCDSEDNYYCPDRQPWTLDEYLLYDVREKVAEKVLYLLHPDRYPDPEAPQTDGDMDAEGPGEVEAETGEFEPDEAPVGDGDADEPDEVGDADGPVGIGGADGPDAQGGAGGPVPDGDEREPVKTGDTDIGESDSDAAGEDGGSGCRNSPFQPGWFVLGLLALGAIRARYCRLLNFY